MPENNHSDFAPGMSGSGKAFGTDALDVTDLAPPAAPRVPQIDPETAAYLSDNGWDGGPQTSMPDFTQDNFKDMLNDAQVYGVGRGIQDPFSIGKQAMFDGRDSSNANQFYERYTEHGSFDELGFTPFRDNEAYYNSNSSAWDDLARTTSQWSTITGIGFTDAAGFGDVTDRVTAQKYEDAMTIGSSSRGGVTGFSNNLFLNSGYTVGIIAELAMEEVAMLGAEFALGIGTVGSAGTAAPATLPAMALTGSAMVARAVRAGNKIADAFKGGKALFKVMDSFKDINKYRAFATKMGKGALNMVNPLDNTMDFYRGLDKLDHLKNWQKATKGFGELYKDVRNVRLAYGEASLEGGMIQNQLERDLLADFKLEHDGRSPDAEEAAKIKETALQGGLTTSFINAPLIAISNKITLPGLTSGAMKRLGSDVLGGVNGKMIFNAKNFAKTGREVFEPMAQSYFKKKLTYIKNPRLIAGGLVKYSQANMMEGFQELAQETIGSASTEYYTAKYQGDAMRGGYMMSLLGNMGGGHGIGTAMETFLSGFLMGGMTAPISMAVAATTQGSKGFEGTLAGELGGKAHAQAIRLRYGTTSKEYQSHIAEQKEIKSKRLDNTNKDANMLNALYTDPNLYFSPAMENLMEQRDYRKGLGEAEKRGDTKTYYDMKDGSAAKHITTALKYGHFDTMVQRLKETEQMTDEELSQGVTELAPAEYRKEVAKAIAHADTVKAAWETSTKKYPNPFNPHKFRHGSPEQIEASLGQTAWNKAIEEMVFNQASFHRAFSRQQSILKTAKDVAGLDQASYSDFNILFVQKDGQGALDTLDKEIASFGERPTEGRPREIYDEKVEKKDKLKAALDAIAKAVVNSVEEKVTPEDYAEVKKAYTDYLKFIAKESGDFTNNDKIEQSLNEVLDYNLLGKRTVAANNAVNTLLDPQAFKEHFQNQKETAKYLYENRLAEIQKSLDLFKDKKAQNDMLNELYDAGMFFDPADLQALEETGKAPSEFYYHEDGNYAEVPMTHEDYRRGVAILSKYLKAKGIDIHDIAIARVFDPYATFSRDKNADDKRTYEDYAKQFGFEVDKDETEVPLKDVLKAIVDSDYASPREKALAQEMLLIAHDNETVTFSRTEKSPGSYSPTRGSVIDAQYNSHNFKEGKDGHPIEHTILHTEVLRRTSESIETDKEFRDKTQLLFDEARAAYMKLSHAEQEYYNNNTGTPPFGLSSLEEFVAEAMSNDRFQEFLASFETKQGTVESAWVKFVKIVLDNILAKFKKRPNGTALNGALELITAQINKVYGEAKVTPAQTTGSTGVVNKDMTVAQIKAADPKLMADLLQMYKDIQAQNKKEGKSYYKDYETMTDAALEKSAQFKQFVKLPANHKKNVLFMNANKPKATTKKPKSETVTEADIERRREEELGSSTLYHTGDNLTLDNISVEPRATRQGKKGQYGGLYTYDNLEDVNKFQKGNTTKNVFGITLKEGVEIKEYDGSIERLSKEKLEQLKSEGYQVIKGKSLLGKTEIIIIDKNAVKSVENHKDINAKYDAELAALKSKASEQTSEVKEFVPFTAKSAALRSIIVDDLGYTKAEYLAMKLTDANDLVKGGLTKSQKANKKANAKTDKENEQYEAKALRKEQAIKIINDLLSEVTDKNSLNAAWDKLYASVDVRAGVPGSFVDEKIEEKIKELMESVTFESMKVGEVFILTKYERQAEIINKGVNNKGEGYIEVILNLPGTPREIIFEKDLEKKVMYRYSEFRDDIETKEHPEATPAEEELMDEVDAIGNEGLGEQVEKAKNAEIEALDDDLLDDIC